MIETDKGSIRLTFDNGYTLSIINGYGSYSENHFKRELINIPEYIPIKSKDCEIAILYENNFVTKNHIDCDDSVKGYVDINELVEIINKVSRL